MAIGFSILDTINSKSKVAAGIADTTEYKEIYLSPYDVKEAPNNTHIECKDIDKLADNFLLIGQQQPTVLAKVNGEYRIIDGHRRNRANIYNLERGYTKYAKVKYFYREMSEIMYELSLLAGNGYTQALTDYEKTELAARLKVALEKARDNGEIVIEGRVRDIIGEIIGEKSTNMARIEKINNSAVPEVKQQFKEGNLGISATYEAAKLPPDEQREIANRAAVGETVRTKDIAHRVAEQYAAKAAAKAQEAADELAKKEMDAQAEIAKAVDKQARAEAEAEEAKNLERYVAETLQNKTAYMSETDTEETDLTADLPEDKEQWSVHDRALYITRALSYYVNQITEEDIEALEAILSIVHHRQFLKQEG